MIKYRRRYESEMTPCSTIQEERLRNNHIGSFHAKCPMLEICPTAHLLGICCNLVDEFILSQNGQMQNINSVPAIIYKAHVL